MLCNLLKIGHIHYIMCKWELSMTWHIYTSVSIIVAASSNRLMHLSAYSVMQGWKVYKKPVWKTYQYLTSYVNCMFHCGYDLVRAYSMTDIHIYVHFTSCILPIIVTCMCCLTLMLHVIAFIGIRRNSIILHELQARV